MAEEIVPHIIFKAGRCDGEPSGGKIKALPTPGYIYLYSGVEDELIHFCWRARDTDPQNAEVDLIMFPGDATFTPYTGKDASSDSDNVTSPTTGRIFVLKFSSSSQRHLFWIQSKSQHPDGNPNWFSARDLKYGQIIDLMLAGEEVNVEEELQEFNSHGPNGNQGDSSNADNAEGGSGANRGPRLRSNSTGGAGSGATGGDVRDEGSGARDGGADGGRAAPSDASSLVQNLLNSLNPSSVSQQSQQRPAAAQFCSLADLLTPETCIPVISSASSTYLDTLLSALPPALIQLEVTPSDVSGTEPSPAQLTSLISSLSIERKRTILTKVLRSAQLRQSLGSLTAAIREGGLPSVSEALQIKVVNGGLVKGGSVPLGGGEAVEAFVSGVRATVREEKDEDVMDTA